MGLWVEGMWQKDQHILSLSLRGLSCKTATDDTWQVNERIRVSTNPKPTRNAYNQCSRKANYKTPQPRQKDINGEEETFLNFFCCFQTLTDTGQRYLISFLFSFHLTTAELFQQLSCANGVCNRFISGRSSTFASYGYISICLT